MIDIRRVLPGDAAIVDKVAVDVFDEPINAERFAAYLAEPNHFMIIALDGDLVVGQCAAVVHRHPDKKTELYIDEVGVSPDWRRRGIARRMFGEMIALGRRQGCEEAWVGTETDNRPARVLYSRWAEAEEFVMYQFGI